jgi:uncharacterized protein YuzE
MGGNVMSGYEREFNNATATYDRSVGAAYFAITGSSGIIQATIPWIEDVVNIDVDEDGNVVGIEVLL